MKLVAVAAHSEPPDSVREGIIKSFARSLASRCGTSIAVLVGGYWGFMKVLVDELLKYGLMVVVFPPTEREDVEFPESAIVLRTGLSFRLRSVAMVRSSDAVVVLGGASGTAQELVTAYTEGKPVYLLLSGLPTDRFAIFTPHLDERRLAEIRAYSDVEALVEDLCAYVARAGLKIGRVG
ncbi:MAG: LOG family protein [Sulfolobales archaeon]|nr:LOG family protein [Sulfolobales archaeon]MCX8208542.1 LOG family protein [Sulfolobales archaeon]MDW8010381.1 LOG family protein [Sulfolobales archaeon]